MSPSRPLVEPSVEGGPGFDPRDSVGAEGVEVVLVRAVLGAGGDPLEADLERSWARRLRSVPQERIPDTRLPFFHSELLFPLPAWIVLCFRRSPSGQPATAARPHMPAHDP